MFQTGIVKWICRAHHREHISNVLLLPLHQRWSPFN